MSGEEPGTKSDSHATTAGWRSNTTQTHTNMQKVSTVIKEKLFFLPAVVNIQHPFISQAKPVSILRDLITEAMEMKAKRQQEQQREQEEEDDNSVRSC